MHTVPGVFSVLKQVQRKFHINKVRQTMNIYPPDALCPIKLIIAKRLWNAALRYFIPTRTTQGFTSLYTCHKVSPLKQLQSYKSIELMVHPGNACSEAETALLTSEWWHDFSQKVKLINYNDL